MLEVPGPLGFGSMVRMIKSTVPAYQTGCRKIRDSPSNKKDFEILVSRIIANAIYVRETKYIGSCGG